MFFEIPPKSQVYFSFISKDLKHEMCLSKRGCDYSESHLDILKVRKGANIRNRYNQVPHLTQNAKGKVTNSQQDTTNKSQDASPFPAGDHKAHINRRAQRHSKHKKKNIEDPQKKYRLGTVRKIFNGGLKPVLQCTNLTLILDVDQDT